MMTGTCLCGAMKYEADGPAQAVVHCHCSMCRKHHGAPFATFVKVALSGFRWVSGEDAVETYQSSPEGTRSFCRHCGSVAPIVVPERGLVFLTAGNLEGDLGRPPDRHIFAASKAPWYTITDSLTQHDEYPASYQAAAVPRPTVSAREGVTEGSCLCGAVAFEASGPPRRMLHCHCSRCRRGRSAAHTTNLYYDVTAFRWVRGQDHIEEFRVPDAKHFAVAFCRECGGCVPRISPERGIAVVPAGTLDTDPGVRATAHIFVGSKASWFTITDDLPQFPEMPV